MILDGDPTRRLVPVVVEGRHKRKEVLMLIDTGTRTSPIDEVLAKALEIEHLEEARIVGVSGSTTSWFGRMRSFGLGGEKLRDPTVIAGPRLGVRWVGMDVLEALKLRIGHEALSKEQ